MKKILLIFNLLFLCIVSYAQTPAEIAKINLNRASFRHGQAGQTAVGQNILLTTSGTAAFDLTGSAANDSITYNFIALQITTSGTTSSGTVVFEGSNDNTTFYSTFLSGTQNLLGTTSALSSSAGINTSTNRTYAGYVPYRYLRLRISVVVVGGGSIGCDYVLSYVGSQNYIQSAVGNNVNVIGTQFLSNAFTSTVAYMGIATTAQTTHVTNNFVAGDVSNPETDINTKLIVRPYSIGQVQWNYAAAASGITNTTTAVTVKTAGAAGVRNCITGLDISGSTLGAGTELVIRDGAAGTVLWRIILGTSAQPLTHISFPSPLRGTAATLLEVATLTASVTGAVYINITGFEEY